MIHNLLDFEADDYGYEPCWIIVNWNIRDKIQWNEK